MQRPVGVRRGVNVVLCPVGLLCLALPRLSRLVRCHSYMRGRSFGLATTGAARPFYGLQVTIVGKLVEMK